MTFFETAQKTLEQAKIALTAEDIWEKAHEFGFAQKVNTTGKTPIRTLQAQLYVSIRDSSNSPFCIVDRRPTRFGLVAWGSNIQISETNDKPEEMRIGYKERELHAVLAYFAYNYLSVLTKTINDKVSRGAKKGKNEWMHPDMVGLDVSSIEAYSPQVLNFSTQINQPSVQIFSFEIKRTVEFSNLRESYFQAVSNSRWANKGYLVCSILNKGNDDLMNEISRLVKAYGVGLIYLNLENPDDSEIVFDSQKNENIDWEFVNYLFDTNADYKGFIETSSDIVKTARTYRERFDPIPDRDAIIKHVSGFIG